MFLLYRIMIRKEACEYEERYEEIEWVVYVETAEKMRSIFGFRVEMGRKRGV